MGLNISDIQKKKIKAEEENKKNEEKEINELDKELESGAEHLEIKGNTTTIKTKNREIELNGIPMEVDLNINRCIFCGHTGTEKKPLFTIDNEHYICKPCLIYGFRTMLLNGIKMPSIEEMSTNEKFDAYQY